MSKFLLVCVTVTEYIGICICIAIPVRQYQNCKDCNKSQAIISKCNAFMHANNRFDYFKLILMFTPRSDV